MPDKRTHRGPHPDDSRLFAAEAHETLRAAVHDLSWLYSRGYASASAMKIVGDRYALEERQRTAVARCSCSDEDRERRGRSRAEFAQLAGQHLSIDGYNVLTSIEAALGGGVILKARDGCFRDMASVHGTWRKVQETVLAVELAGRFLAELGVLDVAWLLDSPVSNSGRLKTILQEAAQRQQSAWTVELVPDPDRVLRQTDHIVATADSGILDQCGRWVNLARAVIERFVPQARIVDLG